jgi:hypothetical protein
MSTINLGSPGVRQDFTVQEGTGFTINFVNSAGNFPVGTCASLTILYTEFDPSYGVLYDTVFDRNYQFPIQNTLIKTQYIYQGKKLTLNWLARTTRTQFSNRVRCFTTRPAPNVYNPFKDYSLLTLSNDTISFVLPSDMTTLKRLPQTLYTNTASYFNESGLTWDQLKDSSNVNESAYIVDSYNYFSMLYVTASYELNVKTPDNAYRPIFGTITKNKSFIPNNIPSCE